MTRTDAVYAAATTRCTTRSSPSADRADHSREAAANPPPAPDTPDSCGPSAATALAQSSEDDTIYEDEDGFLRVAEEAPEGKALPGADFQRF